MTEGPKVRGLSIDLAVSPELRSFRDDLRAWLAAHLTDAYKVPPLRDATGADGRELEQRRAWQRELHSGGWAGVHWPKEHGGRSAGLAEHAIYLLECASAGAPDPANFIGLNLVGPTLIEHGTPGQLRHLEPILSAGVMWSQLWSEPDAGSDLGNISTRARRDGRVWRVTGRKTWSSWGPVADYGLLLARTGRRDEGLRGLSCFLIDLHQPGVDIRPIHQMNGEAFFAEIFLDDAVVDGDELVGAEGSGWPIAATTMGHERTTAILARHATTAAAADRLLELALQPGVPRSTRDRCVAAWSDVQLFRLNGCRGLTRAATGELLNPVSAGQRLQWGVLNRRIFALGMEVHGARTMLWPDEGDDEAAVWAKLFCGIPAWTIAGGTAEIQRTMLGERVLGLPRP